MVAVVLCGLHDVEDVVAHNITCSTAAVPNLSALVMYDNFG
jgi:hypothetical protein